MHLRVEAPAHPGWDAWFVFQAREAGPARGGRVELELDGLALRVSMDAAELELVLGGERHTADVMSTGRQFLVERTMRRRTESSGESLLVNEIVALSHGRRAAANRTSYEAWVAPAGGL